MNLLTERRYTAAAEAAAHALTWGERLPDLLTIGYALHVEATVRFASGDVSGALASAERALSTIGSLPGITDLRATLSAQRVSALIELDRFDEAAQTLRTVRTQADLLGPAQLAAYADAAAELAYQQGRWDDALAETSAGNGIPALIAVRRDDERVAARYLKALKEEPPPGSVHSDTAAATDSDLPYALLARAAYEERADRPNQALGVLRVVLEGPAGRGAWRHTILLPTLIRLAIAAGDESLAKSAAAEAGARQPQLPRSVAIARWCKGLVDGDADQLSAAVDHLRSASRVPELAQALEDLAALRARSGDESAARKDFGDALAISTQLGAAWDARRAVARLRAYGIRAGTRSRSRPRTGPEALTETELRVAELVRQGMSNPDIAERLSLSRRTVETHVSHILAKLGAGSRREIADLLRRD
jgi:DNA-binding CsgD family transcriptional regulator